jgi:hypothetical protein
MKCPNCGKEIAEGKKFCGFCGVNLRQASPEVTPTTPNKNVTPEKQVKDSDTTNRAAKKSGWVISLVVTGAVVIIVLAFFLILRQKSPAQPQSTPLMQSPASQKTSEIAVNPEAAPDSQSNASFTLVGYSCKDEVIPVNTRIRITYGWIAETREQVDDYFNAAEHKILLDGIEIPILAQGLDEPSESDEGYPMQQIWLDIGLLNPGPHEIKTIVTITRKVFDGQDWLGPGTNTASFERICTVTAE